jgi:hypothetical protein
MTGNPSVAKARVDSAAFTAQLKSSPDTKPEFFIKFSGRLGGEVFGYFLPVVDAEEAGGSQVVRGGVKEALAFKAKKVLGQIVDEIVGAEDGFAAAEDVVAWRDEREVALEPAVLGAKGVGDGHGLRGDEDFKAGGELLEHLLRAGHEGQVLEEVLGVEEGAKLLLAVEGCDLPEAFAGQVARSDLFVECLVVTAEVLGEGIRHHLIHVDTDARHGLLLDWKSSGWEGP